MAHHDARRARADGPGGDDVLHLLDRQHLRADGADDRCQHADDDRDDHIIEGRSQNSHDGQHDDQARHSHHRVHHALHDQVDPRPGVGRDRADEEPSGDPDQDGAEAHV
jgi:hypothetical protein